MAYISDQEDEEKQNQDPSTAAAGGIFGSIPGGGTPAGPSAPTPAAATPSSGRFVNFSRFLNANRDAASNTADQALGDVDQQAGQAQQDLYKDSNAFKANLVNPPRVPRHFGPNQAAPAALYAQPSGPASLSETDPWNSIQAENQSVQNQGSMTTDPNGWAALLQSQGRGSGTSGGDRLNAALVNNVGADKAQHARDRYAQLSQTIQNLNDESSRLTGANTQAWQAAQQQAQQAQQQAQQQYREDADSRPWRVKNGR